MVHAGFLSAALPWLTIDDRPGDDRRDQHRRPLFATGQITLDDGDTNPTSPKRIQVDVLNVSKTGVGFRAPLGFGPGATHHLRIGTGPLYLSSHLQIVTSRQRDDGSYDVGARFV